MNKEQLFEKWVSYEDMAVFPDPIDEVKKKFLSDLVEFVKGLVGEDAISVRWDTTYKNGYNKRGEEILSRLQSLKSTGDEL